MKWLVVINRDKRCQKILNRVLEFKLWWSRWSCGIYFVFIMWDNLRSYASFKWWMMNMTARKYWDEETSDSCIIIVREEYAVEIRKQCFLKINCICIRVLVNKCWVRKIKVFISLNLSSNWNIFVGTRQGQWCLIKCLTSWSTFSWSSWNRSHVK